MCGIMGFIRTSRNTVMTKPVVTNVFKEISTRGKDAAGWGMLLPRGAQIEKAPYPSVKMAKWKHYKRNVKSVNMMVGHARMTTMGTEKRNRNNHPHCSDGLKNIVVHNGVIFDGWREYHTRSECDSELILRAIEKLGLKEACEEMATSWYTSSYAWLNLKPEEEKLYAYCDDSMPVGYIDLTQEIGGILIASTLTIIENAMEAAGIEINNIEKRYHELNAFTLYTFKLGKRRPKIQQIAEVTSHRVYHSSQVNAYQNYDNEPYRNCEMIQIAPHVYVPIQYASKNEIINHRIKQKEKAKAATTIITKPAPLTDEQAELKVRRQRAKLKMLADNDDELAQLNEYYAMQESGYYQGIEEI